ncbi:MAG: OmpA family protein [Chitinophagaceae bacterium]
MRSSLFAIALISIFLFSCVSNKKFKAEVARYQLLNIAHLKTQDDLKGCETDKAALASMNGKLDIEIAALNKQISYLKENNTQALKQLENMSVISSQQAESIKKSLDNIGAKDLYIQDLQTTMAKKDSLNMVLVLNLKGAIGNLEDEDINIKVDKGVVYIDISDKLLFKTGSYEVTDKAKGVLLKVSQVLKNQPDIEFMVEGHTDNIPFKKGVLIDNWDLSVKRATSIARMLQTEYGLPPTRISAAGRSEYKPVADNATDEGRAANRRTRIIVLPQLDQFFQLLERKAT